MSTRSVRLDEEAESALAEIIGRTGLSISEAIKKGLIEYRNEARNIALKSPASFFEQFDLGEGGYAIAPARNSSRAIKEKLQARRKAQ
ncbi:MAG: ribbon-helix-helix protein, CopG family [Hahellaceae bacterium]|jgi:hypothetical protein|nr:ribbon-helix-helix protein, CopG family [Hahellaceae bacterium]MCP5211287.1 ribbon-helix-helix protein, CopG family [Hahellaceae bacterium]